MSTFCKALCWSHQVVRDFISVHETRNGFRIRRAGICRAQRVRIANLFQTSDFADRSAYHLLWHSRFYCRNTLLLFLFPQFFLFFHGMFFSSCQEVGIFSTWMLGRFQRNKKSVTRCLFFFSKTSSIEWRDRKLHMLILYVFMIITRAKKHVTLTCLIPRDFRKRPTCSFESCILSTIASSLPWESVEYWWPSFSFRL